MELSYTALLYFDHSTARIERYLFNPNVTLFMDNYNNMLKNNLVIEDKYKKLHKHLLNYNIYNYNRKTFENIYLNKLEQGKFNINFYTIFLSELINNYLLSPERYLNPDMNLIKLLNSNQHINYIPAELDKNYFMVNNKLNKKDKDLLISKYLISTQSDILLEKTKEIHLINVPINFSIGVTKLNDKLSSLFGIKLIHKSNYKTPKCISDLKEIINSKNISTLEDIKNCVIKFNNEIPKF